MAAARKCRAAEEPARGLSAAARPGHARHRFLARAARHGTAAHGTARHEVAAFVPRALARFPSSSLRREVFRGRFSPPSASRSYSRRSSSARRRLFRSEGRRRAPGSKTRGRTQMTAASTNGPPSADVRRGTDREALPLPNALAQSAAARQQLVYRAKAGTKQARRETRWRVARSRLRAPLSGRRPMIELCASRAA